MISLSDNVVKASINGESVNATKIDSDAYHCASGLSVKYVEPVWKYVKPVLDYVEPVRKYVKPVLEFLKPVLEYVKPLLDYVEPVRKYVKPVLKYVEPVRKYVKLVLEYVEPVRKYVKPVLEYLGLVVPPAEIAGIITGGVSVVVLTSVVAFLCWRFPSCRSRSFWDRSLKKVIRKIYALEEQGLAKGEHRAQSSPHSNSYRDKDWDVTVKELPDWEEIIWNLTQRNEMIQDPRDVIKANNMSYNFRKCRKKPKKEEKKSLIVGPMLRKRSRDDPPFVVPQIFVDYGSRRTSYASASDHVMLGALALDLRRGSSSSCGSRRTSLASDSDRRGSASSLCSRRTSFASDTDRRGSASSMGSRRTSIFSDPSDRRGSASSRSSRKGSDGSRIDDTDVSFADFSDSEPVDCEDLSRALVRRKMSSSRRTSIDTQGMSYSSMREEVKKGMPPYRRSHSWAEIQRPAKVLPQEARPPQYNRDQRRSTLSSLVYCSIQAMDQTGAVIPPLAKKKPKRPSVGLPDTPVALNDLNLDEMQPRFAPPIESTGKLKVQLQFSPDQASLTVIIVEAVNLSVPGLPKDVEVNPYVKAFLVPGRTFKYRTKTIPKTTEPLFLEKFTIKEIIPSEITEESAIEFQVYSSHHVSRRHLVGVGSVQLMDVNQLPSGLFDLTLYPQTVYRLHQGDLRISGCFQPVAGKIVFNILEARNLPRVSLLGAINPYVKVEMFVNGLREAKHKTKVRQNTQDPVWHHQCVFDINRENPKLLGHVFVFHMLHKDMMTGVHKIGQVDLGWYCHGEQLEHWYEIMEHPHRSTDYWHPIIKTGKICS
ncbi:uncharacterized protein LOC121369750 [Gigantopelta aegis]|uniref:uncharacterized protein LOC121369750 n=1 Tax=Gigantopelta aegis TaxID=1735272 RepID=UPI001B88D76E|nr:uncharacterized protein LOC121369750 [Gigantopelta aegis]